MLFTLVHDGSCLVVLIFLETQTFLWNTMILTLFTRISDINYLRLIVLLLSTLTLSRCLNIEHAKGITMNVVLSKHF